MNCFKGAIAVFAWFVVGQAALAQETGSDQPSPKSSPTVQKFLDEASRSADAKQSLDSLKAADKALDVARQTKDQVGEASAQQARAGVLQTLGRAEEAVAAWQDAARIWSGLQDTPEQISAVVHAGLACEKKEDSEKFYAEGLSLGKLRTSRPIALAQSLQDAGLALHKKEEELQALSYLEAALPLREKLSPESLEMVGLLNALTDTTFELAVDGNDEKYYLKSKEYATQSVAIGRRVGPRSAGLVESLYYLCDDERVLDSPGAAREHCLEALQIDREQSPQGSLMQSDILGSLGSLEDSESHFALAHKYLEEGLDLATKFDTPGSKHCQVLLLTFSAVESREGDLQASRDHLQQLVALQEKYNGWMAPTYVNLGELALEQDDFQASRDYSQKAVDLFLKTKPKNVGLAYALGNLGLTAFRQGDIQSAFEYDRRLMEIDSHRPNGTDTAGDYDQVGDLYMSQNDPDAAERYYRRAMDIREHINPETLDVSYSLANLASIAHARGKQSEAVEYEKRAVAMGRKSCPNSWCVAQLLNDLGTLVYEQGELTESERYLREAVAVREKSLGAEHPELARSLSGLALTLAASGKTSEAFAAALRAERIGADHLRISVRSLSERQALAYEAVRASGLNVALSLVARPGTTASARTEVLDAVVRSRALVLDELAARHRFTYASGGPELARIAERLASTRAQLATLVFRGAGDSSPEVYRQLLDDARARKEDAERTLAEKSMVFRQDQARTHLGLTDVAASLPQRSALVAYVRYSRYSFEDWSTKKPAASVPYYGAFVLQAGHSTPEFVSLGRAGEIEKRVSSWRREMSRQTEAIALSTTSESSARQTGEALRRRIWDPVALRAGDAKQVFIVPDAALHLVNFVALPTGTSRYLLETGPLIHYISTERDLVPGEIPRGDGILVMGSPAFDQAGGRMLASNEQPGALAAVPGGAQPSLRSACGSFKTLRFTPLPASQLEADRISALWTRTGTSNQPSRSEFLEVTGAEASAEAFERYAPGKRVVHVATHGFFLEGDCESVSQLTLNKHDDKPLPATAENPLLLSGLAFAGANRRTTGRQEQGDGILTAEEIAGINLQGVDWAVLSACDTGVGEIKVGEGVFGLRRAFQVAGAKTVIMSLWPIEDATAQHWMETLYKEHFLNGRSTAEAVRSASLRILNQRRTKHLSTHPFYWGAFIAAGDWH